MLSYQLLAPVGRISDADVGEIDQRALWSSISQELGKSVNDDYWQMGHELCNQFCYGLVPGKLRDPCFAAISPEIQSHPAVKWSSPKN